MPLLRLLLITVLLVPVAGHAAAALDQLEFKRDGKQQTVSGRIVVTAEDGGVLLLARDGALWSVEPQELVGQHSDAKPFEPFTREELSGGLLAELPAGFETYSTRHYLICHNTSRAYAAWCGALFERLYMAFTNFWTRKGLTLHEPEFPLVAIVFDSRAAYLEHVRNEVGSGAEAIAGYYSLQSNRITMYDLTGIESLRLADARRGSAAQINRVLAQPEAEQVVATIIHEATHQIAFNSGLQTRYADIPLWVSEGLAVYFETPDLDSSKGWRTIGAVNHARLERFREYLRTRPPASLKSLVADDARLRNARTGLDAYAEAWALNHYLLQKRPREYLAYLTMLSEKKPLIWDDPAARLREFQEAFGEDLSRLDADFLRHVQKLR
ncbi:MAG: DUF1570 domain-containing protein [Pirellulales bacterium]